MATQILEQPSFGYLLKAVANLIKLPATKLWLNYDAEVRHFYIPRIDKPSSTHSEMREDGILLDYRDDRLVGLTVLEASQR